MNVHQRKDEGSHREQGEACHAALEHPAGAGQEQVIQRDRNTHHRIQEKACVPAKEQRAQSRVYSDFGVHRGYPVYRALFEFWLFAHRPHHYVQRNAENVEYRHCVQAYHHKHDKECDVHKRARKRSRLILD